jgi:hypothetical protein
MKILLPSFFFLISLEPFIPDSGPRGGQVLLTCRTFRNALGTVGWVTPALWAIGLFVRGIINFTQGRGLSMADLK